MLPENCSSVIASTSCKKDSQSLNLSSAILARAPFYLSKPKVFSVINREDAFLLSLTNPFLQFFIIFFSRFELVVF